MLAVAEVEVTRDVGEMRAEIERLNREITSLTEQCHYNAGLTADQARRADQAVEELRVLRQAYEVARREVVRVKAEAHCCFYCATDEDYQRRQIDMSSPASACTRGGDGPLVSEAQQAAQADGARLDLGVETGGAP